MEHGQNFCRGTVVLSSGKPSLIVAVSKNGAVIVPLRPASLPHHRSDVTMPPHAGASMATARCAEFLYENFSCLNPLNETTSVCFGKKVMVRVDEAIHREIVSRIGEQLPPGIVKSTLHPSFWNRSQNWWLVYGFKPDAIKRNPRAA